MKSLLLNLSISIFSMLAFACLSEVVTRIFWYDYERGGPCFSKDEVFGHIPLANCTYERKKTENSELVTYCHDQHGRRCRDKASVFNTDALSIYALGDSFTYGDMVSERETYIRAAEEELTKKAGRSIEIINGGVPGWDLQQLSSKFDQVVQGDFDAISLAILPNDLFPLLDTSRAKLAKDNSTSQKNQNSYDASSKIRHFLTQSKFIDLLFHIVFSIDSIYKTLYKTREGHGTYLDVEYSKEWDNALRFLENELVRMSDFAFRNKKVFFVVIIPQRIQAVLLAGEEVDKKSALMFSNKVLDICSRRKITCFDLMKSEPSSDLYYPYDGHLTGKGQIAFGQNLANELLKSSILGVRLD